MTVKMSAVLKEEAGKVSRSNCLAARESRLGGNGLPVADSSNAVPTGPKCVRAERESGEAKLEIKENRDEILASVQPELL